MSYTGKQPEFTEVVLPDKTTTPDNPSSGKAKIYVKNGKIYILASDGTETEVGSSSGSSLILTYFYG